MEVFISWSKSRSKAIAQALRAWLPEVIEGVDVWVSEKDMTAGTPWRKELHSRLGGCKLGILCLTPENLRSDWIMFEAGALASNPNRKRLCPYLFEINASMLPGPLKHLHATAADEPGTIALVKTLCKALGEECNERLLKERWRQLSKELCAIRGQPAIELDRKGEPSSIVTVEPGDYSQLSKEWNGFDGTMYCYNIELQSFANTGIFQRVWGNLPDLRKIETVRLLLPSRKIETLKAAVARFEEPEVSLLKNFEVWVSQAEDHVAFAAYRMKEGRPPGQLHPLALIFVLSPPFSNTSDSLIDPGSQFWDYKLPLSITGDSDLLNNLDNLWESRFSGATKLGNALELRDSSGR